MESLNTGKKRMARAGRFPMALSAAAVLMLITGLSGTALGKARSVETVTFTPQTFNFEVHPQGSATGNNNITFVLSREEKARGYAKRCRKIKTLIVAHDPLPVFSVVHPGDYRVGYKILDPPLCNFQDVKITGQPFLEQDINSACYEIPTANRGQAPTGTPVFLPGKSATLEKDITVAFQQDTSKVHFSRRIPNQTFRLKANIRCVDNTGSGGAVEPHGQDDILPRGGSTGTVTGVTGRTGFGGINPRTRLGTPQKGSSTPGTSGSAQCDLTGTWDRFDNGHRNTGWKLEEIFSAGSSVTYRAIHLSNQRTPSGNEGAIIRTSSGNYLFQTMATKIPGVNGSYQASSMKIYDADAGCNRLTERNQVYSTAGVGDRPGNYWLQRVGTASPPRPVRSNVGRPTGPANRTFRSRTAPRLPGSTFKPGPDLPKPTEPNWNN